MEGYGTCESCGKDVPEHLLIDAEIEEDDGSFTAIKICQDCVRHG